MQDEGHVSDLEDTDNAHIPKVSTTTWFKPIPEGERPATPEPEWTIPLNDFPEPENNWANTYATTYQVPTENKLQRKTYDIGSFIKWFCRRTGKKKLCKADLEGPAFNLVKAFHKNNVFLQYQMDECHKLLTNKVDLDNPEGHQILRNIYEPLPLGGLPGQVTIQPQFFFNKDLDYLLTGDKERKIALSISKLKAARYLDFGLEELVPSLWVESEREYDISAAYGITHCVKVFEKYGYNYLREIILRRAEIILRRADYQEYKISEKDFKNLHPNDFEDLFLLNISCKVNHLPKTDKTSLHMAVNIRALLKEDLTIVPKPRAFLQSRNGSKKLMRLNATQFSDGDIESVNETNRTTWFKDFICIEYNKAWRSGNGQRMTREEAKTSAIEKRLQIRRIYRSLESFVGGRIRDIDYRLINRTTYPSCKTTEEGSHPSFATGTSEKTLAEAEATYADMSLVSRPSYRLIIQANVPFKKKDTKKTDISLLDSRATYLKFLPFTPPSRILKRRRKLSRRSRPRHSGSRLGPAVDFGMQEGLEAGHEHGVAGTPLFAVEAYNPDGCQDQLFLVMGSEDVDVPSCKFLLKSKQDAVMDVVLDCFDSGRTLS
ncbi:hypothetical protein Tco_0807492 [Tanacetum coccineum]